jgi:hypothetical protein
MGECRRNGSSARSFIVPARLRRLVMDPSFDRQGLACDRRCARWLRVAGLDDLIQASI